VKSARYLAYEKDYFRERESSAAEQHLNDIKAGKLAQAEMGSLYLDILRDVKTVNSCLVEAAAYPILAKHDELLPNRLRDSEGISE
jgi:phosphate:Na+ symporter